VQASKDFSRFDLSLSGKWVPQIIVNNRTLEHVKRQSSVQAVEGTAHFHRARIAKMSRHKNVVVHSDFGPTKTLLAVAQADISDSEPRVNE
jgi:hypothetical protein